MRKRRTFLALTITLCVLVGAYAAIMIYNKYKSPPAVETQEMVIFTCSSISDISYTYGEESLHFVWSDAESQWYYDQDSNFPLKQSKLTAMVRDLKSFTVLRLVQQGTDNLKNFGLDQPAYSFTAITGTGEKVSFQIGAQNATTGHYYLHMDGKDAVYLMDKSDAAHFMLTLNDLVTLDTLPKVKQSLVHELRISGPEGSQLNFVYLPDGSDTYYTNEQHWFLKAEDGSLSPVYDVKIDGILSSILDMKYESCLAYRASVPERLLLGVEEPVFSITVDYTAVIEEESAEGETPKTRTEEATFTLYLGTLYGDSSICARLEGSDMIGLVDLESVTSVLQLNPADLYLRDVCLLKLDEVKSLTIVCDGKAYQIEIERHEEPAADGATDIVASYTVNGEAAEAEKVEKLFKAITALKTESVAKSDPGKSPDVTITFERDRNTFASLKMELVPYDTNFYLVRFAGDNSLLVNRRAVEMLIGFLENFN